MKKIVKNSLGFDSNLFVYQDKTMFNYSIDTILLGNFATISHATKRVLEVGTNNGALAIFLAHRYEKMKIDAVEIQEQPLLLAKKNVVLNHKTEQINLIHEDFKNFARVSAKNQERKYDLIVCNPPFYKVNAYNRRQGPDQIYYATHEVFLTLEELIKFSRLIIKQKGYLAIVMPTERLVDIFELMRKYQFEPKKVQLVFPREDKKSNLVLVESRFMAGWGVHFQPNLYLHTKNLDQHKYRSEIIKLYKPLKLKKKRETNHG